MMRSKDFQGGSRNALDLPVAGFAGLALGFAVFAMPEWRFEQMVGLSGLPAVLSAAQPPLGWTARIAVAAAGAVIAVALTLVALRVAERFGSQGAGRARKAQAAPAGVPIRRRRHDSHPDAPPRPPVSATRDVGEPPASAAATTPDPVTAGRPFWEPDDFPPVEHEEADRWEAERDQADGQADEEPPLELTDIVAWPERAEAPQPVPEPEPALQAEIRRPAAARAAAAQAESIAELMVRLERGLSNAQDGSGTAAAPEPPLVREPPEERLRSALEGLRQLAGRS